MLESSLRWFATALAGGVGVAFAFVAGSYLLALTSTRGRFGWPGFGYFVRETLWVCITQPLLLIGWMLAERAESKKEPGGARCRPIVSIHGYTQNRTNFVWLSRMLRRRGFGPFFGFDYFSFDAVEKNARALERFVERVVTRTGATEVDLVCHSLGGLVARTYVDVFGGHRRVRRVVTLGTPHRGLRHASLAVGACGVDMQQRSALLTRLEEARLPASVRYHSIYSEHDNIVYPSGVSSLGNRGTDVVVRGHGHFGILFSSEVLDHVHRALSTDGRARALSIDLGPESSGEVAEPVVET